MGGCGFRDAAVVGGVPCSPSGLEEGCGDVFGVFVAAAYHPEVEIEDVEEDEDGEHDSESLSGVVDQHGVWRIEMRDWLKKVSGTDDVNGIAGRG